MRTTTVDRLAAIVLGLEGLAVVALVVWQVRALLAGDTGSLPSALALLVLTVIGAAAVIAFAAATLRHQSWGRSGGIVTQLLILAVALGAVTGAYAAPTTGLVLALPAVVALVLLVMAVAAAGRQTRSEAPE